MYQIKEFSPIPPPYGGVSVFIGRLIHKLNQDGITAGGYYTAENTEEDIIQSPLFDLFDWNANNSRFSKAISHLRRAISASFKYSIIHIHGQEMIYLPALMHLLKGQAIVATVHNAMIVDYYHSMSALNRWGFNHLARNNVQWIAVSEQVRQELLKLPVSFNKPILVVPAYIPDDSTPTLLPDSMQTYISHRDHILSFYGRSFMEYGGQDVYGFRTIIRAFGLIRRRVKSNIGLILCISDISNKGGIKELHNYAEIEGVDDCIYWQLGGLKGIRALWQSSDVYIRPTRTDGDSVAIRDVLAEGASVVASDVCPRPEGVVTYKFGDDSDLVEKVLSCINRVERKPIRDYSYYNQMKSIYLKLLLR